MHYWAIIDKLAKYCQMPLEVSRFHGYITDLHQYSHMLVLLYFNTSCVEIE